MLVCITCQWRPDKKEGLGVLLRRALDAGKAAGLGAPAIDFRASEVAIGKASAIARVVKRYPELAPLRSATAAGALPGGESLMSQRDVPSPLTEELLLAVADGIPRSWALQSVSVALHWPVFGALAGLPTGMMLNDMAWISGRRRVLAGVAVVEAEPAAREIVLPPSPRCSALSASRRAGRSRRSPRRAPNAPVRRRGSTRCSRATVRRWSRGSRRCLMRLRPTCAANRQDRRNRR